MAKKKPEPAPEAQSFMELIRKVGNETAASLRKEIAEELEHGVRPLPPCECDLNRVLLSNLVAG
jgi:hypothetical protein